MTCKRCKSKLDLKLDGNIENNFVYCSGCGERYNRNRLNFKNYSSGAIDEIRSYFKTNKILFFKKETYNGAGNLNLDIVKILTEDITIRTIEGQNSLLLDFHFQLVGITQNFSANTDGTLHRDAPVLRYVGFSEYSKKCGFQSERDIKIELIESAQKDIITVLKKKFHYIFGDPSTTIEFITLQHQIKQCVGLFGYIEPHPEQMIPGVGRGKRGKEWL